jgi:CheY-like chemotaxis protein
LLVTAGALPDDVEQCLAAGMESVVTKPVSIEQLRNVLERAATRRRREPHAAIGAVPVR